jgi:hypothetical protein
VILGNPELPIAHKDAMSSLLEKSATALFCEPHPVSGNSCTVSIRDPDGHILSIFRAD